MINYKQVRQYHLEQTRKPTPAKGPKVLIFGFAFIILVGTILLKLPISSENGALDWGEAFFTAVSATTVTGLVVVATESTFSTFGEIVILALMQVGGVGFITLSVILYRLIGRRMSINERNLLRQVLGNQDSGGVVGLALVVLAITIIIEFIGSLVLFSQWVQVMPWQPALYYAIFHAVSAYCNAGFDLFQGFQDPILLHTRDSPIMLITLSLLITIGTLGITVIYDLLTWPRERHLSLHTRLILPFTLILTVAGTSLVVADELIGGYGLSSMSRNDGGWLAFFTIVSSRTAGITLVPVEQLGKASQLVILVWMFVGGAPASMAGGVGLGTVAVVLLTLASNARGYDDVRVMQRTFPTETIVKAVAVLTVSTAVVVCVTLGLALMEDAPLFTLAFETVSAYSNTGYSLSATGNLGKVSRILIALTMFWGRLGPLTLVVALAQRSQQTLIRYPEEKILIG